MPSDVMNPHAIAAVGGVKTAAEADEIAKGAEALVGKAVTRGGIPSTAGPDHAIQVLFDGALWLIPAYILFRGAITGSTEFGKVLGGKLAEKLWSIIEGKAVDSGGVTDPEHVLLERAKKFCIPIRQYKSHGLTVVFGYCLRTSGGYQHNIGIEIEGFEATEMAVAAAVLYQFAPLLDEHITGVLQAHPNMQIVGGSLGNRDLSLRIAVSEDGTAETNLTFSNEERTQFVKTTLRVELEKQTRID